MSIAGLIGGFLKSSATSALTNFSAGATAKAGKTAIGGATNSGLEAILGKVGLHAGGSAETARRREEANAEAKDAAKAHADARANPGYAHAESVVRGPMSAFATSEQKALVAAGEGPAPGGGNVAADNAFQKVADKVLDFGGVTGKVAKTLMEVNNQFEGFKAGLIDGQRRLVAYNGTIAGAFAQLEVGDIQRNLKSGQNTEGSTKRLLESENRLKDAWRPFNDSLTNAGNNLATFGNDVKTAGIEAVSAVREGKGAWGRWFGGEGAKSQKERDADKEAEREKIRKAHEGTNQFMWLDALTAIQKQSEPRPPIQPVPGKPERKR